MFVFFLTYVLVLFFYGFITLYKYKTAREWINSDRSQLGEIGFQSIQLVKNSLEIDVVLFIVQTWY